MTGKREVKTFSLATNNSNMATVKKVAEKKIAPVRAYTAADTRRLQANLHKDLLAWFAAEGFEHRLGLTDYIANLMCDYMIECGEDPDVVNQYRTGKALPVRETQ